MASVLITGASRGIGRAIAVEFARRGHRVVATARDPRTLDDLPVAERLALDVTDDASVAAAIHAAGDVDVLISNAGVIFHAAVEAIPLAEFDRLLQQNTIGALRVAQAVLPQMRARGRGRLLFMSSVVGRIVLPPAPHTRRRSGRWRPSSKHWPSKWHRWASKPRCWSPRRSAPARWTTS